MQGRQLAPRAGLVPEAPMVVRALDVAFKLMLVLSLAMVLVDPHWGNLEGKAPLARAITYPMLAFAIPVWWWLRPDPPRYPWTADLLLTLTGFSDILGNRLDLYDQLVWFDDWMHVMNTGLIAGAVILLTLDRDAGLGAVLERGISVGVTAALGWEVFEYFSFVTRSDELRWAYGDTVGDLALGWLGAVAVALAIHTVWRVVPPASRLEPRLTGDAQARPPSAHVRRSSRAAERDGA